MNVNDLVQLPFEIQAVLAAGYLAYRLATAGLDRSHRATDVIFQVFVYGTISYLVHNAGKEAALPLPVSVTAGIGSALLAAALWRALGKQAVVWVLRKMKVTRENFAPSTLDSIIDARLKWTYLSVDLVDDRRLECNITALPKGLPFQAADVDTEGNIALYVTRLVRANGEIEDFDGERPVDQYGRAHITYVPKSSIRSVRISFGTATCQASVAGAGSGELPSGPG
ncbi:MAG: hypothetical protein RBS99_14580 [Rhodospirillales bacterium]|jgi:hypothetical protein|nr:hypothetical protein [Rhodospirillales bacterium]